MLCSKRTCPRGLLLEGIDHVVDHPPEHHEADGAVEGGLRHFCSSLSPRALTSERKAATRYASPRSAGHGSRDGRVPLVVLPAQLCQIAVSRREDHSQCTEALLITLWFSVHSAQRLRPSPRALDRLLAGVGQSFLHRVSGEIAVAALEGAEKHGQRQSHSESYVGREDWQLPAKPETTPFNRQLDLDPSTT